VKYLFMLVQSQAQHRATAVMALMHIFHRICLWSSGRCLIPWTCLKYLLPCRTCCRALARNNLSHSAPQTVLSQLNLDVSWPGSHDGNQLLCLSWPILPCIKPGLEMTGLYGDQ